MSGFSELHQEEESIILWRQNHPFYADVFDSQNES